MKSADQAAGATGGWSGPVQLIRQVVVSGTVTGDVLEGIAPGPMAFVRPPPGPLPHAEFRSGSGGPWRFLRDFGGPTTSHKCQG